MHSYREFSEETARIIDIEVQDLLKEANQTAIDMLKQYRAKLDELAEALLENEDLERPQIRAILGPRPGQADDDAEGGTTYSADSAAKPDAGGSASMESDTIAGSDTRTDDITDDE